MRVLTMAAIIKDIAFIISLAALFMMCIYKVGIISPK
jgi:4-hydroxybenzoate polyprenyltransferase